MSTLYSARQQLICVLLIVLLCFNHSGFVLFCFLFVNDDFTFERNCLFFFLGHRLRYSVLKKLDIVLQRLDPGIFLDPCQLQLLVLLYLGEHQLLDFVEELAGFESVGEEGLVFHSCLYNLAQPIDLLLKLKLTLLPRLRILLFLLPGERFSDVVVSLHEKLQFCFVFSLLVCHKLFELLELRIFLSKNVVIFILLLILNLSSWFILRLQVN